MGLEEVKAFLKDKGFEDRLIETGDSSKTVALAAQALGCKEESIVKSMAFLVEEKPILILLSGDVRIDNRKFKETFRVKAKMVDPTLLRNLVGHPMGGVCPFALKEDVKVYLDKSLEKLDILYPAGGTDHSAVKLTLDELKGLVGDSMVDVSKE